MFVCVWSAGVCTEETSCGRVSTEDGRAVRVCSVHCKSRQGLYAWWSIFVHWQLYTGNRFIPFACFLQLFLSICIHCMTASSNSVFCIYLLSTPYWCSCLHFSRSPIINLFCDMMWPTYLICLHSFWWIVLLWMIWVTTYVMWRIHVSEAKTVYIQDSCIKFSVVSVTNLKICKWNHFCVQIILATVLNFVNIDKRREWIGSFFLRQLL